MRSILCFGKHFWTIVIYVSCMNFAFAPGCKGFPSNTLTESNKTIVLSKSLIAWKRPAYDVCLLQLMLVAACCPMFCTVNYPADTKNSKKQHFPRPKQINSWYTKYSNFYTKNCRVIIYSYNGIKHKLQPPTSYGLLRQSSLRYSTKKNMLVVGYIINVKCNKTVTVKIIKLFITM